jgi:hypothetical protein
MHHHEKHKPYYDVAMPPEALDFIRENIDWSTPVSMVSKVQGQYPNVTAQQVHYAWTTMSETLWKHDKMQLPSAKALLEELGDVVDIFHIDAVEGVEQLCWGMKQIAIALKGLGKITEVAFDATCRCLVKFIIMSEH